MKKILSAIILFSFLCSIVSAAYEPEFGEILYGTPTIDGLIDDIYKNSYSLKVTGLNDTFHSSMGAEKTDSKNDYAIAYYLYDNKNLYVCVMAYDDDLMSMGEEYINNWLKTKDDLPWRNDAVEVRIAFKNNPSLIFQTDAYGIYTVCYQNKHGVKHDVAVTHGKDYFIAEFSIPFVNGETAGDSVGVTIEIDDVHNLDGNFNAYGSQKPIENQVILSKNKAGFTNPFIDINAGDWYYNSVNYVIQNGIMGGTANLFNPDSYTTRSMLVTMLWRMEGMPQASAPVFKDVTAGLWYSDAVAWSYENKIVLGKENNLFDPENYITREELASILYNYSQFKGKNLSYPEFTLNIKDIGSVSPWARTYVEWAIGKELLKGDGMRNINPQGFATRAETATVFMRYLSSVK